MTPVKQRFLHRPPESYGDCHRAAIASPLDLCLDDVPHFMRGLGPNDGEIFNARQKDFLDARGLAAITIPVACNLNEVFPAAANWNPGTLFVLGGMSESGCGHSVIAGAEGIVHDPHPRDVGIAGPMDDGFFWVTYIVGKVGSTVQ